MAETLLAFKAGRASRRGATNFVDPNPTKGAIMLTMGEDGLLHFMWKNRTTNDVEEDLILFPSDATFSKVIQANGRVYVLKFSSSDQRHFFWMQDASSARDEEFMTNLNGYLQDSDYTPVWSSASQPQASSSAAGSSSQGVSGLQPTPEQLAELQAILLGQRSASSQAPELSLTDILTPANVAPLFTSHPELITSLFPHLPPDLPTPPSADALERIIKHVFFLFRYLACTLTDFFLILSSPQFRAAVSNFDQALRTGLLGGLVSSLGLPEEAGTGIEPFLRAIQEQANREHREDQMDTD
ncbi:adhesion regulating molecule [Dendrothele bispora CBS 962.96]|uniref:Adhesion regulating molecule n=1 Tax=Dendrothele bispora (strain CBS 962.96) TaxID=1314807 RepID=A0A4S8MRL3_DENBC|nr:adhesion regulating molecule [Dendrothele bispora CBS 962.96]